MLHTEQLKKKLELARFIHILSIIILVLVIFLFTTIPYKRWILLTVIVLSAGIQPGLILRRAWHRITGTFLALLCLLPLLYLMQLNYRFIPVIFIAALIAAGVTGLNPERYDIKVFFTTIVVFLLIAQTIDVNTPEGPFEMVINRGLCTLIGAAIILISDYVLFNAYQYSQKLYLYHQMMLYDFLKNCGMEIKNAREQKVNTYIFIDQLRNEMINHFLPITVSSKSLLLDINSSQNLKRQVMEFQNTIWEIRHIIFALTFSEIILYSKEASHAHWQQYTELMDKARHHMIKLEQNRVIQAAVQ